MPPTCVIGFGESRSDEHYFANITFAISLMRGPSSKTRSARARAWGGAFPAVCSARGPGRFDIYWPKVQFDRYSASCTLQTPVLGECPLSGKPGRVASVTQIELGCHQLTGECSSGLLH
jgi:hypothetical protein